MMSPHQESTDSVAVPAVDLSVLDTLVEEVGGGDRALLSDLIDSYLPEASGQVTAIETAARDGDAASLARVAHSMRSASASLGALSLAELLTSAEDVARRMAASSEESAGLAELAAPIRREYDRVAVELEQVRSTA